MEGGAVSSLRFLRPAGRAISDCDDPTGVIVRLDRAIQYSRSVLLDCPVEPGDDNELGVNRAPRFLCGLERKQQT